MFRYSTATIKFKVTSTLDFSKISEIWVTISDNYSNKKTWKLSESEVTTDASNNTISISLTQEDSALFKEGVVDIQLRILDSDGNADASAIKKIEISKVLEEEVMNA